MPPAKRTKARAKAVDPEEEELDGLDEELAALENATDLDDLELDESEPEDEEIEAEIEEPTKRTRSKKAAKAKAAPEPEEEELEEDEEDDEDGDELDDLDRKALKAYIKENEIEVAVYKSHSDDDIRENIRAELGEDDEEEIEEEEAEPEPPKKKGPGRPKGSGAKAAPVKAASEDPAFSTDDVAAIGDIPEHSVRGFARKYPKAFPKASPKARYVFNARQVRALLKGLGVIES